MPEEKAPAHVPETTKKESEQKLQVSAPNPVAQADPKSGGQVAEGALIGKIVTYAWPDSFEGTMHNQGELTSAAIITGENKKEELVSLTVFPNSTYPPFHVTAVPKGDKKTPNSYF